MALVQELQTIREAYTFDDVLLKPGLSDILPSEADIRGDRRQRSRDNRRIHVLHEQGGSHDEWDQAFFGHQNSERGTGKKREEGL